MPSGEPSQPNNAIEAEAATKSAVCGLQGTDNPTKMVPPHPNGRILKIPEVHMTKSEKLTELKIRSEMLNVKCNFSYQYSNDENSTKCQNCSTDKIQSQEHIPDCEKLKETVNINYSDFTLKYQSVWHEWTSVENNI